MLNVQISGPGLSLPQRLFRIPDRLVEKYSKDILREIKRETPVRSGRMRSGWELRRGTKMWRLTNKVPYARFVVRGTRKVIYPRTRKYLRFVSMGKVWYKRWVRGQRPRPILYNAIRRARPRLAVAMRKILMGV